ncbi:MAG TPA: hypothetical protein VLF42_12775 [Burkholderiales bacterium]|nr:hypothetical protein [Burkholderiales bacterium]
MIRQAWRHALPVWGVALLLSGCAAVRSYDAELYVTLERASSGAVDDAIRLLESNNRGRDKGLLYYLELGMLERLAGRYEASQKAWKGAAARIQAESAGGLAEASRLARAISSYVVNDRLRAYPGHDYEKVMLLTYMALNHLAMSDFDGARVAIKQAHELEAQIAELRARQYAEVEESARKRGAHTSFKELNGYPIETLDTPEVNALRNAYQSALSHYLAGFIYEALGEPSLAAPGYRLANELQPGQPLLEEALRGLDERVAARPGDGMTEVLVIVNTGSAPAIQSRQFMLPVVIDNRLVLIANAFPVMTATSWAPPPAEVTLGGASLPVARITSIDLMARRRLMDDMPSIMLRATIRSTVTATLQYQAQRASDREHTLALALAAGMMTAGTMVFAAADDRTWRALPSEVSIARARVPHGVHTVTLDTPEGPRSAFVSVSGRYAVVDLRLLRHQLFVSAPKLH